MFKCKKNKTGCETPELRKSTIVPSPKTMHDRITAELQKPLMDEIMKFGNETPYMQPVKSLKENANNLSIKTLESIKIEVGKNGVNDTASIEIAGLQTAIKPTVSTKSSSTDHCNLAGELFNIVSVSWRDAFVPEARMYLTGVFEDYISGELIYGEYDLLNYSFVRKENYNV